MAARLRTAATAMLAAAGLVFAPGGAAQAQEDRPVNLRGQIQAADGNILTVKERSGQILRLGLDDKTGLTTVVAAKLADIKVGSYVGTAAERMADGTLRAQEIHIFPEQMRGVGEGHRPHDLTANSTMTNAAVEGVVAMAQGSELKLKYKDGEKTLVVVPGTPIVTYAPPDRSLLRPGVFFVGVGRKQADGSYALVRISLGRDGLAPPM